MTETRTTSSTGGQKGVKPQRHSLIPRAALDVVGEVYAFGAEKYDDHNWRKGYEWSKSYDALQRHLTAWWDGEDRDPESGLSHLGHALFHVMALATWEREGNMAAFDDRYQRPEPDEDGSWTDIDATPFGDDPSRAPYGLRLQEFLDEIDGEVSALAAETEVPPTYIKINPEDFSQAVPMPEWAASLYDGIVHDDEVADITDQQPISTDACFVVSVDGAAVPPEHLRNLVSRVASSIVDAQAAWHGAFRQRA